MPQNFYQVDPLLPYRLLSGEQRSKNESYKQGPALAGDDYGLIGLLPDSLKPYAHKAEQQLQLDPGLGPSPMDVMGAIPLVTKWKQLAAAGKLSLEDMDRINQYQKAFRLPSNEQMRDVVFGQVNPQETVDVLQNLAHRSGPEQVEARGAIFNRNLPAEGKEALYGVFDRESLKPLVPTVEQEQFKYIRLPESRAHSLFRDYIASLPYDEAKARMGDFVRYNQLSQGMNWLRGILRSGITEEQAVLTLERLRKDTNNLLSGLVPPPTGSFENDFMGFSLAIDNEMQRLNPFHTLSNAGWTGQEYTKSNANLGRSLKGLIAQPARVRTEEGSQMMDWSPLQNLAGRSGRTFEVMSPAEMDSYRARIPYPHKLPQQE